MIKLTNEHINDKLNFIYNYMKADNAADGSKYDPNANVSSKDVATLGAELYKDFNIQLKRSVIFNKLKELYDEKTAKEYLRQVENHEIYIHDETGSLGKPYCAALSIYPLLLEGVTSLGGESRAPKHLHSFCGIFSNFIPLVSNHFVGAIAVVETLMVFDHFARKDFGDDYLETNENTIKDFLQHIVYAVNEPSRNSQSVFFNLSIFDKYYFNTMFNNFVFPDGDRPNWETLNKLQKYFMKWFNNERTKALLTFPVVTAAMLTQNGKPKDKEFADFVAEELSEGNAFFIYMSDTADSLSSCCFDGSQKISVCYDGSVVSETLEEISTWVDKEIDVIGIDEKNNEIVVKAIPVKIKAPDKMYKITYKVSENFKSTEGTSANKTYIMIATEDHIHRVKQTNDDDTFIYVDTYSLNLKKGDYLHLINNGLYAIVENIEIIDYNKEYVYCLEVNSNYLPYFKLDSGIITHNCRLRNDVSDQINEFSYTLGGTGVSTGSIQVITINMNRLVQDNRDIEEEVQKVHKYLTAYRKVAEEFLEAGMLPVYNAGYISLDRQYLTVGINGLVEAAEYLGFEISNNEDYKSWLGMILKAISDLNKDAHKRTGYKFNTELVPAEGLGVKNAKWDKEDGYEVPRDTYNSYFYKVEDDSLSILNKFEMHGQKVLQYLDGGSALHCNLEEYPTKEGFKKLLDVAATTGCNYFCFNIMVTCCEDCGYIDKQTKYYCSKCGSKNVSHATRVIGYLKKIKNFSKERQKEAFKRNYHQV